jgi:hypothetical protein
MRVWEPIIPKYPERKEPSVVLDSVPLNGFIKKRNDFGEREASWFDAARYLDIRANERKGKKKARKRRKGGKSDRAVQKH